MYNAICQLLHRNGKVPLLKGLSVVSNLCTRHQIFGVVHKYGGPSALKRATWPRNLCSVHKSRQPSYVKVRIAYRDQVLQTPWPTARNRNGRVSMHIFVYGYTKMWITLGARVRRRHPLRHIFVYAYTKFRPPWWNAGDALRANRIVGG